MYGSRLFIACVASLIGFVKSSNVCLSEVIFIGRLVTCRIISAAFVLPLRLLYHFVCLKGLKCTHISFTDIQ